MPNTTPKHDEISPLRLRIGVGLLLIWWLPIWMISPYIASLFNSDDEAHLTAIITVVIMLIQTAIGFLGIYIAGKQVSEIVKKTPKSQAPSKIWSILRHGAV